MSECNCGCRVQLNVQEDSPVSLQVLDGDKVRVGCADFFIRTDKDYNHLENKPQINDVELVGNKSLGDLGITTAITEAITSYVDSGGALFFAKQIEGDVVLVEYRAQFTPVSFADIYSQLASAGSTHFMIGADIGHLEYAGEDTAGTFSVIISTNELRGVNKHYWFHASNETDPLYGSLNPLTTYYGLGNGDIEKLNGIESGAQVNVQSDWDVSNPSSDAYIKNKPGIPTKTSDLSNDSDFATNNDVSEAISDYATPIVFKLTLTGSTSVTTNFTYEDAEAAITGSKPYLFLLYDALEVPIEYSVYTVDSYSRGLPGEDNILTLSELASGFSFCKIELMSTAGSSSNMSGTLTARAIPTKTSQLTNNSGFITAAALPTKTSDLTNDGADGQSTYVEADELSAVATSGSYTDLTDKPTIPTVNDASLTIQKNGTTVATFTANASANATANIAVPTKTSDLTNDGSDNTSTYLEADETAYMTASIPYGTVDGTSTATAFTATVPGITELRDGVCMLLKNGVVTSAAGFTINVNGLGAKPSYNNMAAATADTTIFNINYTMMFIYDETRVSGGCWICYRGYNSDTNTIGYQLRTNSSTRPVATACYRYRLLFSSPDNSKWVPANSSSSTNATASRNVTTEKINPFGDIRYYSYTTALSANANVGATYQWDRYAFALGYSFNRTGAALTLTYPAPVYIKCAPNSDGSANIDTTTPYVQALPSTEDGKIYIYLGQAYSATNVELMSVHPVYYYKDGAIREWTDCFVPTKTSDLTNDSGFITDAGVTSFNGSTGAVTYSAPVSSVNGQTGAVTVTEGLAPLIGTTFNITPTQVKTAIAEGRDVAITYTSPTYGVLKYCGFNSADTFGVVASQTIITYNNQLLSVELLGSISDDGWGFNVHLLAQSSDIPTATSDLTNDSGFLTSSDAVTSFNGQTGAVTYSAPVESVNGQTGTVSLSIPDTTSALINDSGFITDSYHDDTKENLGKITISDIEYTVTRKALSITDNGVTTTYYVADIT